MIEPKWSRIAGIHLQDDGSIAAVWAAYDKITDTVHLYDTVIFHREVMAVIAEGMTKKGKWIPVAWHPEAKEIVADLQDRGCQMTPEPCDSSQPAIELASLNIRERMRSGRFTAEKHLEDWREEFRTFYRDENLVPVKTHPLMSATRYMVMSLADAAKKQSDRKGGSLHPKMAIV